MRHHHAVERPQLLTELCIGHGAAARQREHRVPCAEHPAFQRCGPRPSPQIKPDAPPRRVRVGGLGGVFALQQQILHPHSAVFLDQLQRCCAHTAAPQVIPHGKVVEQRRALGGQHHQPRIGQPRSGVIGQKQRFIHPRVQQALYLRKRLQLRRWEVPRQGRAVEFLTFGRGDALDLHSDFSFPD